MTPRRQPQRLPGEPPPALLSCEVHPRQHELYSEDCEMPHDGKAFQGDRRRRHSRGSECPCPCVPQEQKLVSTSGDPWRRARRAEPWPCRTRAACAQLRRELLVCHLFHLKCDAAEAPTAQSRRTLLPSAWPSPLHSPHPRQRKRGGSQRRFHFAHSPAHDGEARAAVRITGFHQRPLRQ